MYFSVILYIPAPFVTGSTPSPPIVPLSTEYSNVPVVSDGVIVTSALFSPLTHTSALLGVIEMSGNAYTFIVCVATFDAQFASLVN